MQKSMAAFRYQASALAALLKPTTKLLGVDRTDEEPKQHQGCSAQLGCKHSFSNSSMIVHNTWLNCTLSQKHQSSRRIISGRTEHGCRHGQHQQH